MPGKDWLRKKAQRKSMQDLRTSQTMEQGTSSGSGKLFKFFIKIVLTINYNISFLNCFFRDLKNFFFETNYF